VLRHLAGSPEVDPDCGALELRLRHWLREIYNHTPHQGLGGDTRHGADQLIPGSVCDERESPEPPKPRAELLTPSQGCCLPTRLAW